MRVQLIRPLTIRVLPIVFGMLAAMTLCGCTAPAIDGFQLTVNGEGMWDEHYALIREWRPPAGEKHILTLAYGTGWDTFSLTDRYQLDGAIVCEEYERDESRIKLEKHLVYRSRDPSVVNAYSRLFEAIMEVPSHAAIQSRINDATACWTILPEHQRYLGTDQSIDIESLDDAFDMIYVRPGAQPENPDEDAESDGKPPDPDREEHKDLPSENWKQSLAGTLDHFFKHKISAPAWFLECTNMFDVFAQLRADERDDVSNRSRLQLEF